MKCIRFLARRNDFKRKLGLPLRRIFARCPFKLYLYMEKSVYRLNKHQFIHSKVGSNITFNNRERISMYCLSESTFVIFIDHFQNQCNKDTNLSEEKGAFYAEPATIYAIIAFINLFPVKAMHDCRIFQVIDYICLRIIFPQLRHSPFNCLD